jgi:acid phosphatase type 7
MEVESNRLDMKWIASDGVVRDRFTIVKDVNRNDSVQIEKGQSVELKASYVGNYAWNTGATTSSIDVSPDNTTEYVVSDGLTCLSDTMKVVVTDPLPVRFSHFLGSFQSGRAVLRWRTAEEVKADYFVVERSWDGHTFTSVGKVGASGDSNVERFYRFTDEDLSNQFFRENVYYRLREVDLDGRWQFSGMIVVKLFDSEDHKLIVKPNPSANEEVFVELAGGFDEYDLILANEKGQILLQKHFIQSNVPNTFSLGKLMPGTYVITAAFGREKVVRKIIVQ